MSIEIKLTGDTMSDIVVALRTVINVPDARTIPLDDLMAITKARFKEQGFMVMVTDEIPHHLPPEDAPTPDAAIVADVEAALAEVEPPKRKPGRPVGTHKKKPPAEPAAEPAGDVEADRSYVLDELTRRFGDDAQKTQTKAFIDRVAHRNGGIRLTLLDHALFPAIRAEMEAEFAASGNGVGGRHA